MRVLVTGSTGTLGRHVVRAALTARHAVRAQSRQLHADDASNVEWVQADLASGAGVDEMVVGADAIVHAASDPRKPEAVDVEGTRRLIEAAHTARVEHLIYVSIVGIDRIPLGYYRAKAEAERIVAESGLPHSILRATQFHAFVDQIISAVVSVPLILPLPTDFQVQSVAAAEVAGRLVRALTEGPSGRLVDFAGPERMTLGEAAVTWRAVRGVRKPLVRVPLFGAFATGFRAGHNTVARGEQGTVRWEDWLARELGRRRLPEAVPR